MGGMHRLISEPFYRKELVAGNLGEYIIARTSTHLTGSIGLTILGPEFHEIAQRVGDDAVDFSELEKACSVKDSLSMASLLRETLHALPLVC